MHRNQERLAIVSKSLASDCLAEGLRAKNITIKIKFASFTVKQKSVTLPRYISTEDEIYTEGVLLLKEFAEVDSPDTFSPIRLLGLRLAAFDQNEQERPGKDQSRIDTFFKAPASRTCFNAFARLVAIPFDDVTTQFPTSPVHWPSQVIPLRIRLVTMLQSTIAKTCIPFNLLRAHL
jgi:hypothetical protein